MKELSKSAGLSETFTNHCIRATATTILSEAGCESRNIMSVTGHRNESSIKSYVAEPSLRERAKMCDVLHSFGKSSSNALQTTTVTESVPDNVSDSALVLANKQQSVEISHSSSIFYGANFSGATTINVQVNQK